MSGYLEAPHRKLIFPYYTHFWWHLWQLKVYFVGLVRKKIKFITYMFYLGLPYYYWKYHFWRNLTKFGEIHMRFPNFKYIVIVQILLRQNAGMSDFCRKNLDVIGFGQKLHFLNWETSNITSEV